MQQLLLSVSSDLIAQSVFIRLWDTIWPFFLIFAGFSTVIFVHELGHFMAAKWMDVRVDRFAIGFAKELVGFTRGETRYSFNILPLGGYVKMLGQEDFDDKTLEYKQTDDPRSFINKTVGQRAIIVSAGVIMNILFAALVFMFVFLDGIETNSTTIGQVLPESPAALAGLRTGDKILKIDDRPIREYQEIRFAVMLADPHKPLKFDVERGGETQHVFVTPRPEQQKNLLQIGILSGTTNVVVFPLDARFDENNPEHLQPRDKVIAIEGEPLEEAPPGGMEQLWRTADGSSITATVERLADVTDPNSPTTIHDVTVFNQMLIEPSDPLNDVLVQDVLGLIPLVAITNVAAGGRAELAGVKPGDVILQFGSFENPSRRQIIEVVGESARYPDDESRSWRERLYDYFAYCPETDIPVRVWRDGKEISLVLTPKAKDRDEKPRVGFDINGIAQDTLRVAGVRDLLNGKPSPASEAGIPAGALIETVNGRAVKNWPEMVEAFRLSAGTTVLVEYVSADGQRVTCDFRVPHSLLTKMGLTTLADVIAIDGKKTVKIELPSRWADVAVSHSFGLRTILNQLMDRSGGEPLKVTVAYTEIPNGEVLERSVALTSDMVDPWLARIRYLPAVFMQAEMQTLKADGPVDALMLGVRKTSYFVLQVYTMMQRMIVSRSVGVEHLAGPVGIVKMGSDVARVGFMKLLFFLAIISANLAVINFLPLPIVDGGLMVFLIIEKIKGSPVSMKVQVATQMIGIVLIGAAFLFVTFQDVVRLAG